MVALPAAPGDQLEDFSMARGRGGRPPPSPRREPAEPGSFGRGGPAPPEVVGGTEGRRRERSRASGEGGSDRLVNLFDFFRIF